MPEFSGHMRLVVDLRDVLPIGTPYQVGLLTKAPTPEGWGGRELVAEGYERQDVEFEEARSADSKVRNRSAVAWDFAGVWPATHVALFTAQDQIAGYGPIEGVRPIRDGIVFKQGGLELRK